MAKHTIFWRPGTGSFAVEALLEETGAPYERVPVTQRRRLDMPPHVLKLNPLGQVPVLVLPDGSTMTESAAMVIYLADLKPAVGLAPPAGDPKRPHYLRWILYAATNIYPTFMHIYHGENFHADEATFPGMAAMARENLARMWTQVEAALDPGPFLLGARPSAADLYLMMFPYWYEDKGATLRGYPRLAKVCAALRERPAVQRVWAHHANHM
jgi:glutathione S-transferase